MVENYKLKNMQEHCKKFKEQMQNFQQEFQESLVDQQNKWQEHFGEQNIRADKISLQIEMLSKQFQTFLANQIVGKDLGSHLKGILNTPTMNNQEGMLPRGRSHIQGNRTSSQEH
jgi:hypothetical protein